MNNLKEIVSEAQDMFHSILENATRSHGISKEQYVRFLSMQFHLTKGVQKHMFTMCGHPDLGQRKSLRDFLVRFALEEEYHYDVARLDLKALGEVPLEENLDVKLWWAYFNKVVQIRPFVRLGTTCVLENIASKSGPLIARLLSESDFINDKNNRFVVIHQHEDLPHGDQIFGALEAAKLESRHISDLEEGARTGTLMYLRLFTWAFLDNKPGDDIRRLAA